MKKGTMFIFLVIAAATAVSSAAFACTVYRGIFTVQGLDGSPLPTPVSATGNNVNMNYCGGAVPSRAQLQGDPATAETTSRIRVTVAPSTGTCQSQLNNLVIISWAPDAGMDCMSPNRVPGAGTPIGEIQLNNGSGTGDFVIPRVGQTSPSGSVLGTRPLDGNAGVCVTEATGIGGNKVPVDLI